MDHMVLIEFSVQTVIQDGEISSCTKDCPVSHFFAEDVCPIFFELLFLTI